MKRFFLILFLIAALLLTACAQWNERMIEGVWQGNGDLVLEGVDAPFDAVETLMFNRDFSGFAVECGENMTCLPFTWAVTDDTLTLRFSDIAVGLAFRVTGSTLSIQHSAGSSQFNKLSADKFTFGGNYDSD